MHIRYILVMPSTSVVPESSDSMRLPYAVRTKIRKLEKACPYAAGALLADDEPYVSVVAGRFTPDQLEEACQSLRTNCARVIVITDAIPAVPGLKAMFDHLQEGGIQLATTAALLSLVKSDEPHLYAYPRANNTATVCILFEGGEETVVIERKHDPYAGCLAFPGGFLKPGVESVEQCAVRELEEELSLRVNPAQLQLIDLRSKPCRDPRDHVIDAGYLYVVPKRRRKSVLAALEVRDDAASYKMISVSKLLRMRMAFDHKRLLKKSVKRLQK